MLMINILAVVLYGIDKYKAIKGKWRVPESTLIGVAAWGGALGALLGMFIWHHKIRKWKFRILVPFCLLIWIAAVFLRCIFGNEGRVILDRLW